MKARFFLWSGAVAACFSGAWVLLLAALVVRSKLSDQPFPVLAKFSPFRDHLLVTDRMLIWSFDISTPDTKDITEVQVNAKTGKVVSVERETPAAEAKGNKKTK